MYRSDDLRPKPITVRVLVLGDSAVGKSSLIDVISSNGLYQRVAETNEQPCVWTCGCSLTVAHENVEVDMRGMEVEVELWEVGGSANYANARSVFYEGSRFDAVVLVYDISNMKSYHHLVLWLFELCNSALPPSLRYWDSGGGSGGEPDMDLEGGGGPDRTMELSILSGRCPVLFVANKADLRPSNAREKPPRPAIPERPPLLDRLLGFNEGGWPKNVKDRQLMDRFCDFIRQGRHTEASARLASFDFPIWRDFVRRIVEARRRNHVGP